MSYYWVECVVCGRAFAFHASPQCYPYYCSENKLVIFFEHEDETQESHVCVFFDVKRYCLKILTWSQVWEVTRLQHLSDQCAVQSSRENWAMITGVEWEGRCVTGSQGRQSTWLKCAAAQTHCWLFRSMTLNTLLDK